MKTVIEQTNSKRKEQGLPSAEIVVVEPDDTSLIVRQYFKDRPNETPIQLEISSINHTLQSEPKKGVQDIAAMAWDKTLDILKKTQMAYNLIGPSCKEQFVTPNADALFPTRNNSYLIAAGENPQTTPATIEGFVHDQDTYKHASIVLYDRFERAIAHVPFASLSKGEFSVQITGDGPKENHAKQDATFTLDAGQYQEYVVLLRVLGVEGSTNPIEINWETPQSSSGGLGERLSKALRVLVYRLGQTIRY